MKTLFYFYINSGFVLIATVLIPTIESHLCRYNPHIPVCIRHNSRRHHGIHIMNSAKIVGGAAVNGAKKVGAGARKVAGAIGRRFG